MCLVFSGAATNAQFSGFTITKEENLQYVRMLALEAHARGLAIGIKNSPDDLPDLIDHFDFAVVESFFYGNVAPNFSAMTARGKPVQLDWVVQKLFSPVNLMNLYLIMKCLLHNPPPGIRRRIFAYCEPATVHEHLLSTGETTALQFDSQRSGNQCETSSVPGVGKSEKGRTS